ncbi:excinuclease ABC subunit UvrA [Streptomonospora sp. S1-112]|uniref:UvrABC system protein A n=1 Tax=Streptomonospora mangrovi TaxID=2883123 RepID=A0A9X3NM21_9ACTN|nr:excinuclease ABC subunit UvrA [Streptomonospora mangrovi]MDA0564618.1 excinuclease ABC subunit UvrA [Streptomonospora mangrovi]
MTADRAAAPITVVRARENNLKDVSLRVPKGRLTVFTGVSGSGKSSVVFDTIAAEAQRRLNELFPAFVRNRMPLRERPGADAVDNLTAAVVVDQRPLSGNARSTVGTATEVHPVLRVLFSRLGEPGAGPASAYSFNDPQGMCTECEGLGRAARVDTDRLLDEDRSLNEGAIRFPAMAVGTASWQLYAESGLFDPDKPLRDFTAEERDLLLHGSGFRVKRASRRGVYQNEYEGVVTAITRRYLRRDPDSLGARTREAVERVAATGTCAACGGTRLNEAARASVVAGHTITGLCALEITDLVAALEGVERGLGGSPRERAARPVLAAALAVLRRVADVGLGYLSLDRATTTLSGGEAQRLKTVRYLGSGLTGLTYVFDEPSAGLHPRDVHRLGRLLLELRDQGNTVLLVEHDRALIALADHVVDMGPGAGTRGGRVVFEGTVEGLRRAGTLTARRLTEPRRLKPAVRTPTGALTVRGADLHNLRGITVDIPTGVLTAVTGVAGSGKSSLVTGALPAQHPGAVVVDQSAVGASARATPGSYVDVLDTVRGLFAAAHGVRPGLFSFNSAGACPTCRGRGTVRTDLAFLEPVTAVCEDCGGGRFSPEVLELRLAGRSIADVLAMTADEAAGFFTDPAVLRGVGMLREAGLGYLTLGQPLSTLSGGELQRLKLAQRMREGAAVYVLDEPTTGLHPADVDALLELLDRIVDRGGTAVVAEHDLGVVRNADWVIDIGPEAGRRGGTVVFEGVPAALAAAPGSVTGEYLRRELAGGPA